MTVTLSSDKTILEHETILTGPHGLLLWGHQSRSITAATDQPVLVFVHGLFQSASTWSQQQELAHEFELIRFDLPDHGHSGSLPGGKLAPAHLYAASILRILDAYQLRGRRVFLVLWSYALTLLRHMLAEGGPSALEGVAGLIIEDGLFDPIEAMTRSDPRVVVRLSALYASEWSKRMEALYDFLALLSEQSLPRDLHERRLAGCVEALTRVPSLSMEVDPRLVSPGERVQALSQIQVPVLLIHGVHDALIPLASSQSLLDHLPTGRLLPLDCGHSPHLEVPDRFNQEIRSFVSQVCQ